MKSKLTQYKALSHLPLKRILRQMHLTEDELYSLMRTWNAQGVGLSADPVYAEIQERRRLRLSRKKHEANENLYLDYQLLRHDGLNNKDIAIVLNKPIEKIEKYQIRWYKDLRLKDMSRESICEEMQAEEREIMPLEEAYEEKKRLLRAADKKRKKHNAAFAQTHLSKLADNGQDDYLIFDLEGTQNPDELIEIAVIDFNGKVLLNTLVRPEGKIGWHVSRLTGITDAMAAKGAKLSDVMKKLRAISNGKTMLSWGTDYDKLLIERSIESTGIQLNCSFACAQHIHMGHEGLKNQIALHKACNRENQSHRALDDCNMVLEVLSRDIQAVREEAV